MFTFKKIKKIMTRILFVVCFGVITLISCKKSDEAPKVLGCIDSLSLNYNKLANTDDGSCIFPADKLVGNWNGKDEVSAFNTTTFSLTALPTVNYKAVITKSDKVKISIVGDRPDKPVYLYTGGPLTINWSTKKISVSGASTSITGTIINENSFSVNYVYGASPIAYTIKQTYTR
jgi:hypothetical protein